MTLARTIILGLMGRIREGELIVVERDGTRHVFGAGAPHATVEVRDERMWGALMHGSRGLAESYRDGWFQTPDLSAVIRVAARNATGLDGMRRWIAPVREPWQRARGVLMRNTPLRSRKAISAHYDLGNELFGLMLDPTMMYSCAVFESADATLEEAAVAKLDLACSKLELGPDDHVLEIGTGWGGFALHAARTTGCRVTTTTISREQHDLAVARIAEAGLQDRITVLMQDYRDLEGRFDKLVSIEMIEAVGWTNFDKFFERCSELLHPEGAMFLQAIVMDDRAYAVERESRSFIRTHIFPDGCLPSVEVIAKNLKRHTDLRTVHLEDLTPHYSETLRRWRSNFDVAETRLEEAGYDEAFRRMWRFYLCYCEAGFAERRIGLVQSVLAKPHWRGAVGGRGVVAAPSAIVAA